MLIASAGAAGHHSSRGVYDGDRTTLVQGRVESILWRNPHVRFTIRGSSGAGRDALWDVEGASPAMLGRKGISPDVLEVGDLVRVAGNPSVRGLPAMYVTNVLLPDGREVLTLPRVQPLWSDEAVRWSDWERFSAAEIAAAEREAEGIFRVWTTDFDGPRERLWNETYPLTPAAEAARAEWEPENSPYVSCEKGMPAIMEQPYPLEFVARGDVIELHIEEYDVVRTIEMDPDVPLDDRVPTTLGHSAGWWDGETLVVRTTGIDWPWFDQTGIPLNPSAVLVERFTSSADGRRLDYRLTVSDPAVFTEPVVLETHWAWKPGEQVKPFDCAPPDAAG